MKAIDAQGFEEKFQDEIDPWNYRASPFEAFKRRVLLRACGHRLRGRGLELACAIGVTTRALSPICLRLIAQDSSQTALAEAEKADYGSRRPVFLRGVLPRDFPGGTYDLIVVSEIAYYLSGRELNALTASIIHAVAPGGRVVVLHHLRPFEDAAQLPVRAQGYMTDNLGRHMRQVVDQRHRHFAVAAFERPRF